ncbi:MAG: hypothetical protein AAF525_08175 [Pseudomonadota bacterium]
MKHCPGANVSGFGLPFTIFVLLILGSIALGVTALEESSNEMVAFDVQSTRAFLAAQSGVELGINRLLPPGAVANDCTHGFFNSSPSISFSTPGLDDCEATVTCTVESASGTDYFTLTSQGTCGSGLSFSERVVEAAIR